LLCKPWFFRAVQIRLAVILLVVSQSSTGMHDPAVAEGGDGSLHRNDH
jgi:hypothetical protein